MLEHPVQISVSKSKQEMSELAAAHGAQAIREAIATRGKANIIVATGASQFEVLDALAKQPDIAWDCVTGFHLDEYAGLPLNHPASFRLYLWARFVSQLPVPLRAFHWISGEDDCRAECRRLGEIIRRHPIDVAFVGIGENGHLAFNDPPADFETVEPYLVVELDEACRRQQLGEGWFPTFEEVPQQAISMSVNQILNSCTIICTVPDERKSTAVRNTVKGEVSPAVPASILQRHADTTLFLDESAASQLTSQ